jgi:hypothetical protein
MKWHNYLEDMKYKVELNYVCCQDAKPWWSKIEIKGSQTRIAKKKIDRNGCDKKENKEQMNND